MGSKIDLIDSQTVSHAVFLPCCAFGNSPLPPTTELYEKFIHCQWKAIAAGSFAPENSTSRSSSPTCSVPSVQSPSSAIPYVFRCWTLILLFWVILSQHLAPHLFSGCIPFCKSPVMWCLPKLGSRWLLLIGHSLSSQGLLQLPSSCRAFPVGTAGCRRWRTGNPCLVLSTGPSPVATTTEYDRRLTPRAFALRLSYPG